MNLKSNEFQRKEQIIDASSATPVPFKPGCDERYLLTDKAADSLTMLTVTLSSGQDSGMHKHDTEEAFFFLKGKGRLVINNKEHEVKPNICVYLPAGMPHNLLNTGKEPLVGLVVIPRAEYSTEHLS